METEEYKILVQLLKEIAKEKGITQETIAKRTGYAQSNIGRIFSLKYPPMLEAFLNIAKAIEVNLFFEDKEGKTDLNVLFERAMANLGRRNLPFRES